MLDLRNPTRSDGDNILILVNKYMDEYLAHPKNLAPSPVKNCSRFQLLMDKLPPTHKAKWFVGAVLNSADQTMASVLSTAMSRLNAFLDSEMEQMLCCDSALDTETFFTNKSAIFIVLPE